jgi:hypothetical protein
VALPVCLLVAGCGGGGGGEPQAAARPAAQPSRASVEISLRGDDTRRVVFGHPLEFRGVVRPSGDPVTVRLLSSEYPYPVSEPVQSTTTGEGGSFRFTVRPEVNTMYSVSVRDKVSRHIQVYAMPDQQFRVEPLGPRSGVFIFEIKHPLSVTPTDRPVLFYVHFVGGGSVYERVAHAHLDHVSAVRAVARVKVTVKRQADDAVACVPAMIAANFGDPPLSDCGRRRVRVPRRH